MAVHEPAPRIAVLGAGVMGANIATLAVGYGFSVELTDVSPDALEAADRTVRQQLRHARLMGVLPAGRAPGELRTGTALAHIPDSTVVIEAITEEARLKKDLLAEVSAMTRAGTILVSNTSGIPIDELADSVKRPAELVGTHFMNPTYLIKMVEVIRGPRTDDATMANLAALLEALGRRPVVVRDAPGFVTSRLLHPMINEAARIVAAGTAEPADVDALMEGCLGHPTGPLRTADLIGLDNLVDSLAALYERTGQENCRPCELLVDKVREGALGRKSGRGFYHYGTGED